MPDAISHEQAIELLPWLVNDTLPAAEKERVQAHVRNCIICRRDIEELEVLRDAVASARQADDMPAADMRRINRRIDDDLARRRRLAGLPQAVRAFLSSPLHAAVVAQSMIIAVLALLLLQQPRQPAVYTTLTDSVELPAGEYLRIVVDSQMSEETWSELLVRFGLGVVDGPSENGVATLSFDESASSAARDAAVSGLAANPHVRFVQALSVTGP